MVKTNRACLAVAASTLALGLAAPAEAALTLTPTGVADGFSLSTFAITDPGSVNSFNYGPFGLTVVGSNVLVSDDAQSKLYTFSDINGQTPATALFTRSSSSGVQGYATAGGLAYGTNGSQYVQFNADGSINHVLTGITTSPYLGIAGVPNGHLIAASGIGLIDIDPTANGGAGTFRVIKAGLFPDGVSVSADGLTAIVEDSGLIQTYNVATGALISSYSTSGSPDGTGVIVGSALNGDIIANTNSGKVDLIDTATNTFVTIASGGTRGDYTSPDPNDGSLLLDYSEGVFRLSIAGGSIGGTGPGGGGTPVPEPSSMALFALALCGAGLLRRIKQATTPD